MNKQEAIDLLTAMKPGVKARVKALKESGYPSYTTAAGWLGYDDEKMIQLCKKYQDLGFTAFKIKIGQNLERDIARCQLMRDQIGYDNTFMIDSNQIFDVNEAIHWVSQLKQFRPLWIEEPTSPDDVLGNAKIAEALRKVLNNNFRVTYSINTFFIALSIDP